MATQTFNVPQYSHPRPSTETDRRHLLSDDRSVAASESISAVEYRTDGGDLTPRPASPALTEIDRRGTIADPTPNVRPYRGFPSEAHYLAALQAWVDSKKYVEHDTSLVGFYGETTMDEYCSRPKLELGLKKKLRERKEKKEAAREARRNTVV